MLVSLVHSKKTEPNLNLSMIQARASGARWNRWSFVIRSEASADSDQDSFAFEAGIGFEPRSSILLRPPASF
jgi:hypothetical protein